MKTTHTTLPIGLALIIFTATVQADDYSLPNIYVLGMTVTTSASWVADDGHAYWYELWSNEEYGGNMVAYQLFDVAEKKTMSCYIRKNTSNPDAGPTAWVIQKIDIKFHSRNWIELIHTGLINETFYVPVYYNEDEEHNTEFPLTTWSMPCVYTNTPGVEPDLLFNEGNNNATLSYTVSFRRIPHDVVIDGDLILNAEPTGEPTLSQETTDLHINETDDQTQTGTFNPLTIEVKPLVVGEPTMIKRPIDPGMYDYEEKLDLHSFVKWVAPDEIWAAYNNVIPATTYTYLAVGIASVTAFLIIYGEFKQ